MQDGTDLQKKSDSLQNDPMCKRVREGLVMGAIVVIVAMMLRFFAPKMTDSNYIFKSIHDFSNWLFVLGSVLFVLTFAFWLADGMLSGRNKNQS